MEDLLCNDENVPLSPQTIAAALATEAPRDESQDPVEVIRLMATREAQYGKRVATYLADVQRHGMEEIWRRKICRWMFDAAKAFELTRDSVACAIYIMDRYLSTVSVDKIMLQLVSMVSLSIASKMHEHQPISMEEMEMLSQRKFTRDDIRCTESKLLETLSWRLNPPTSFMFARDFIHVLQNVSDEAKVGLEDDVMAFLQDVEENYGSLRFRGSSIGIAAVHVIWNTRKMRPSSIIQDAIRAVNVTGDNFVDCFRWLRDLHCVSHQPQQQQRFVSVEETKTADSTPRSISPTSVEEPGSLEEYAEGQLSEEILQQIAVDAQAQEDASPEPERKRARRETC